MARGTVDPRGTTWPFLRLGPDEWERLGELQGVVEDVAVTKARDLLAELARRGRHELGPATRAPRQVCCSASGDAPEAVPAGLFRTKAMGSLAVLQRWWGVDSYRGTWAQLVEAGVVTEDEKPGQPGNGVNQITVAPDGSRRTRGAHGGKTSAPGTRIIRRTSKDRYSVDLYLAMAERQYRREHKEQFGYPADPLKPGACTSPMMAIGRPGGRHLRLVWSAA